MKLKENNGVPAKRLDAKRRAPGAEIIATAALIAAQVFSVTGCVGKIKPSREPAAAMAGDCDEILNEVPDESADENSAERLACMKKNRSKAEKTCRELQNEETTAENVHKKLDCVEYKFSTDPPKEGVSVFSWH